MVEFRQWIIHKVKQNLKQMKIISDTF